MVFLLIMLSVERFDLYSMSTYFIQRFLIARGFISSVFFCKEKDEQIQHIDLVALKHNFRKFSQFFFIN